MNQGEGGGEGTAAGVDLDQMLFFSLKNHVEARAHRASGNRRLALHTPHLHHQSNPRWTVLWRYRIQEVHKQVSRAVDILSEVPGLCPVAPESNKSKRI